MYKKAKNKRAKVTRQQGPKKKITSNLVVVSPTVECGLLTGFGLRANETKFILEPLLPIKEVDLAIIKIDSFWWSR